MGLPGTNADDKGPQTSLPGARAALGLLLAINLFNYIDRQVLAAVEPEIRKEMLSGESEAQALFLMGLLPMAFLITYMVIAPLFGWLADRMARWKLVGIGVILWSLASGASGLEWGLGLAAGFWLLLLTRCFVGIGEGAYGPVAPTMIADLYPIRQRGGVLAWFYLAIPVGGALGYAWGEVVKDAIDWRWAFYLVVPPGLILGVVCFLMPEPPRGQADLPEGAPVRKAVARDYLQLFKIPSYVLNTAGMTAMTFAIGGLAYWMPAYLDERSSRAPGATMGLLGLGPRTTFGAITAVSGLFATLLGGLAGDKLRSRYSGSYFLVSSVAMACGFPMMLGFLWAPFPWAWVFCFLVVFCLFFNTGPTNTIIANVAHPAVRASAYALNILLIHALGDAISPSVIGIIAGVWSMEMGFIVVSVFMLVGAIFWLFGTFYLARDTALAPSRLD